MDRIELSPKTPSIDRLAPAAATEKARAHHDFASRLAGTLEEANELLQSAEQQSRDFAAGRADSVETILALSKAELALRHVVTVRNRVIEAYQDVMRMQL